MISIVYHAQMSAKGKHMSNLYKQLTELDGLSLEERAVLFTIITDSIPIGSETVDEVTISVEQLARDLWVGDELIRYIIYLLTHKKFLVQVADTDVYKIDLGGNSHE
jgi:hypothetical protein